MNNENNAVMGLCNEAKAKSITFFKKVQGKKILDESRVKLGAGVKGCIDGKAKFRQEAKKILGKIVRGLEKSGNLDSIKASEVPIPSWEQVGTEWLQKRIEQRKAKETEYEELKTKGEIKEKKSTPMLVPDEVIALISRAEYESLWENYKKGFKKGWEKATELYKMQLNAIIMKLKMPQKEVKESEIGDIEELEEEQEEEGEETEEGEDEETDMANVARRSNKKPAVKARVKKTWTPPPNVKEFLKWSKRDYDLQRQEIFKYRVNQIVFKDNLLIHIDESADKRNVITVLAAILDFVEEKWKPDFVYDITIKFT